MLILILRKIKLTQYNQVCLNFFRIDFGVNSTIIAIILTKRELIENSFFSCIKYDLYEYEKRIAGIFLAKYEIKYNLT